MEIVYDISLGANVGAVISESSPNIFENTDLNPVQVVKNYRGYVPWGDDNLLPLNVNAKIGKSEVMSSNMFFNILAGYGAGINIEMNNGEEVTPEITDFFDDNYMPMFFMEQQTDLKHYFVSFVELILNGKRDKIVDINHLEAVHTRFETANTTTGVIENIFFANWNERTSDDNVTVIPLLDYRKPFKSLLEKVKTMPKQFKFAMAVRIPIPGRKYYPIPYYHAAFNSGWYDISIIIPVAKAAMMKNGMKIKYHIEIHKDYFPNLFKEENISDPTKQVARRKLEYQNIVNFLSGAANSGKAWFSIYYVDPNGKEQSMVRINIIDTSKAGGDYIEDAEEAANFLCYAQLIHPSLIGAAPGKSKGSLSGTDKREVFTMKQSMETVFRDLLLQPLHVVKRFNKWPKELQISVPHLMLTTLDKGTDAMEVDTKQQQQQTINTDNNDTINK